MSSPSARRAPSPADDPALHPVLADLPGHLLWRAHARVCAAGEDEQRAGVDLHAVGVLRALGDAPSRSQQELADAIGVSRTTMTRVASALVGQGLVERVRNPEDRRSYALTRTDAGVRAVRAWSERADAVHDRLARVFTRREHDRLVDLLARVAEEEAPISAPPAVHAKLGFLIARAHARMHRDFLAALAPLGLEPRLYATLILLAATGPIPQSEVARLLGISGASLVQIADDLEALGLVERRRDPLDRRAQLLHLRPAAAGTMSAAREVAATSIGEQLAGLSGDELTTLVALLQRFVTAPGD